MRMFPLEMKHSPYTRSRDFRSGWGQALRSPKVSIKKQADFDLANYFFRCPNFQKRKQSKRKSTLAALEDPPHARPERDHPRPDRVHSRFEKAHLRFERVHPGPEGPS